MDILKKLVEALANLLLAKDHTNGGVFCLVFSLGSLTEGHNFAAWMFMAGFWAFIFADTFRDR